MSQTPMIRQYTELKNQHPDAILLFRLGDFYEMFFNDALQAAETLDITLTSRPSGKAGRIPMAGVPHHAAAGYISQLLDAGHKVAICEQVDKPGRSGLMERRVVRVMTPGTVLEDGLLDQGRNNYIASLAPVGDRIGLAVADLSTGEFMAGDCSEMTTAMTMLSSYAPTEVLVPASSDLTPEFSSEVTVTRLADHEFLPSQAASTLKHVLGVKTLAGFELDDREAAVAAAGALAAYASAMQCTAATQLTSVRLLVPGGVMWLDESTRRNLELTRRISDGSRQGTVLSVIDRTLTPGGRRKLRRWLEQPLTDRREIEHRLDLVASLEADPATRGRVRGLLSRVRDIERLSARTVTGATLPRDLSGLRDSLITVPRIGSAMSSLPAWETEIEVMADPGAAGLGELLTRALVDDPATAIGDGPVIRSGYNTELDELRSIGRDGRRWIAELEATQRGQTGIKSLKVGYNKVFGYYIEVTRSNLSQVPDSYIRKQTLANAERFVTPELKEREAEILTADERAAGLERQIVSALCDQLRSRVGLLQRTADAAARVDVAAALAEVAIERQYVRPELSDRPVLTIRGGRHPVLDAVLPAGEFVPNDCLLDEGRRFAIVTGPNMAGKSTYLRQVALMCLLAQAGSFVPAETATIGIVDRVFTRVGAGDDLSRGQSTFMVEMTEVAGILANASESSLVILDEVGRGTSTFDGLSLARAVSEYIISRIGARTLFATHYHELTDLGADHSLAFNLSVAVRETGDGVVFLRQVVPGAINRSYGIEVARLAGLPRDVLNRARDILRLLESESGHQIPGPDEPGLEQPSLFAPLQHPIIDQLSDLNLAQMTPLEALQLLFAWQRQLRGSVDS